MKIIKTILDKPYLVILIAAIITLVSPNIFLLYSIGIIIAIFSISIIYFFVQKKWLRLLLSFLSYIMFFIIWIVFAFLKGYSDDLKPQIEIADSKFYATEILKSTNLDLPKGIRLIAKIDTIIYTGLENEYDAECLYVGTEKIMIELENNIISRKDFIRVSQLENYPTKVLTPNNFNLNELKSVYKYESDGRYIIFIAFNKSYSKFYYSAIHY